MHEDWSIINNGKIMKMRLTVLVLSLVLISVSCLYGEQSGKAKVAAILGLSNGASVGLKMNNIIKPRRVYYINAAYCQNKDLLLAGMNLETRFNHAKNFYTLLTLGIDYFRVAELFGDPGGGDSEDKDKFSSGLLPHVSGGIGYTTPLGKNMHLYIELDVGVKASIANINIGLTM
jgi:hypothetical protein